MLFEDQPDFTATDAGDPTLIAPFTIDNVKGSKGDMQCQKDGDINTLELTYEFGSGDLSVARSNLVMRALLAAFRNADVVWADAVFKRMSKEAFAGVDAARLRGDEKVVFGRADVDLGPHLAGTLVITPEQVTLSFESY